MTAKNGGKKTMAFAKPAPDGYEWQAPEGGWGWVVTFGCLLITMMLAVPPLAFGILLKDMQRNLGISTSAASWTVSTALAVSQLVSPVCTILIHKFSCRLTAILGGFALSTGLIFSSFATNLPSLLFTFGILTGLGIGMGRIPCLIVGSEYFPINYSIVAGVVYSGFSIGRTVFSPMTEVILDEYGYKSTYIILGGLCLNVWVGAALWQPAERHYVLRKIENKKQGDRAKKQLLKEENGPSDSPTTTKNDEDIVYISVPNNDNSTVKYIPKNGTVSQNGSREEQHILLSTETCDENNQKSTDSPECDTVNGFTNQSTDKTKAIAVPEPKTQEGEPQPKKKKSIYKSLTESLDITLFKEPLFYVISTSSILGYLTVLYSNVFLVPLGIEKGFSTLDASLAFSAKAGAEIAGRLGCPWIQKLVKMDPILFFICICLIVAGSLLAQAFASNFTLFIVIASITGIATGGTVVVNADVMLKSVGVKRYSSTMGLCCFIQGWFALFAGPLIGLVRDITGNFVACYILIMALQFIAAVLWIVRYIYLRCKKDRNSD